MTATDTPSGSKDRGTDFANDFVHSLQSHQATDASPVTPEDYLPPKDTPTGQSVLDTVTNALGLNSHQEPLSTEAIKGPPLLSNAMKRELKDLRRQDMHLYIRQVRFVAQETCVDFVTKYFECRENAKWYNRVMCEKHSQENADCYSRNLEKIKQELGETSKAI
ncbi:hypothetical protein H4R34_000392 [Dimargaris verticillata]|uniref:Uncharacterized protein n=1 Tax=Dimargaris verticillata TaxID=2761393 RepID=A0A9W8BBX6_9FUNG|nr:hypothetical protein H4R34_000392 [Dimargaris verticillata]